MTEINLRLHSNISIVETIEIGVAKSFYAVLIGGKELDRYQMLEDAKLRAMFAVRHEGDGHPYSYHEAAILVEKMTEHIETPSPNRPIQVHFTLDALTIQTLAKHARQYALDINDPLPEHHCTLDIVTAYIHNLASDKANE